MIYLKTDEEIELMRESNLLVGMTLGEMAKWIAPGITTLKLDKIAEEFIRDHGAQPGFLGYGGFPNTLCISVNEVIVHGIPNSYALREGDIVSIDCGRLGLYILCGRSSPGDQTIAQNHERIALFRHRTCC